MLQFFFLASLLGGAAQWRAVFVRLAQARNSFSHPIPE
jgi:hypothetical protein